jgi:uncharacterized coiled-coil DUF342 family protein
MHLFSWQANNEKDDEDADRIGSPKLATKDVATDLATLVKNEDDAGNNVPQVKMEPMESDDDNNNLHSVCCKRIVKLEVQMEQSSQQYQARIRQLEQQQLQDDGNNEADRRAARKIVELEAQLQARNAQNGVLNDQVVWLEQEIQRVTVNCCCAVVPLTCFSSKPLL